MLKLLLAATVLTPLPMTCGGSPEPPAKPPCEGSVLLLEHIDAPVNCDLNPPQVLAAILDDSPDAWQTCDYSGGAILHDPVVDRFYCINIDY